jgi:hypothetical protein
MFLQQSVVEPLDASFTELIQATDDTPNLLSCGICNKRYKTMSIQGTNLDALDMHISNKKFSSLVLEFETIENPNKHTQIDEKDKSTT